MGIANTFITDWDAKFTYNFWRPITAIRNGDKDGNDATERDPGWTPLERYAHASGIPVAGGHHPGVARVSWSRCSGPNRAMPFAITDLADPKLKREYKSIAEMAAEHANVRVWGGIHFRNSLEVGEDMGGRSPHTWSRIRSSRCVEENSNREEGRARGPRLRRIDQGGIAHGGKAHVGSPLFSALMSPVTSRP